MLKNIRLKKGLKIRLKGSAEKILNNLPLSKIYSISPLDFPGLTPKMRVKAGEEVLAGDTIFVDKYNPEILFSSPISGKILEVVRGERRLITNITIEPTAEINYKKFEIPSNLNKESITKILLESGVWPFIRQRPYSIVAKPTDTPKAIFISGFDNAPLAPDYDFVLETEKQSFAKGIEILSHLTEGKINIGVDGNNAVSPVFSELKNVEITSFTGPHPSSTVGVQIHHTNPINKGDIIWYVNPQDVLFIARLFDKGIFDAKRIVASTGSEVNKAQYFKTMLGASITEIVKDNVAEGELRYISGNVLTGTKIEANGYVGFYHSQISVIPEGNYSEFLGWGMPGLNKFSPSKTFFSYLFPKKQFTLDTNFHGGGRAFVLTGEYEKVVPMDIYPQFLLKAILAEDIDKMEELGIYEVSEEDFALCEYVCTSKQPVQQILRDGFNLMIKEMG